MRPFLRPRLTYQATESQNRNEGGGGPAPRPLEDRIALPAKPSRSSGNTRRSLREPTSCCLRGRRFLAWAALGETKGTTRLRKQQRLLDCENRLQPGERSPQRCIARGARLAGPAHLGDGCAQGPRGCCTPGCRDDRISEPACSGGRRHAQGRPSVIARVWETAIKALPVRMMDRELIQRQDGIGSASP